VIPGYRLESEKLEKGHDVGSGPHDRTSLPQHGREVEDAVPA
jgi:hypothetical protein